MVRFLVDVPGLMATIIPRLHRYVAGRHPSGQLRAPLDPPARVAWGQVYRARDTRLGRDVAIKVLPGDGFTSDPDRLARFEREALGRWTALNHPRHCGHLRRLKRGRACAPWLLELVEGENAGGNRIARGLNVTDALAIARQYCRGARRGA